MSSTNSFDIPLRGRPYSQDVDDGNAILSDLVVRLAAMLGTADLQYPGGFSSGNQKVCAGLAPSGIGTTDLTISAGSVLGPRPTTYPTPGTYDTTNLILSTSSADTVLDVSAIATAWHLIGARPAIVPKTTLPEDVFNTSTGQFQATTVTIANDYTFELYLVAGTSDWPAASAWAPNASDIPICLIYFDGATITQIVDLRVLPGDNAATVAPYDEGRTQYKCSSSLPTKLMFNVADAIVGGQRGYAAGLPIFIDNPADLAAVLDLGNSTTPIAAKQQYWVYLCPVGGYMPRNAYGAATSTRGLIILSRAAPQKAVIASTSFPGEGVRVNSADLTIPTQFGGGLVVTGSAVCLGFVESGNTTGAWRTMWSEGDNDHRFGQSPEVGAFPGTPNWLGWTPSTPGTGAAFVTVSIYKSGADATVIDTATRFARSILLDIRVTGNPAPGSLWMALPANNSSPANAGDLATVQNPAPAATTLYMRSRIPGEEFASGTTCRLFSDVLIPATTDCGCELLGYSW